MNREANKDYKLKLTFDNGWEVSIVHNEVSYGLELATFYKDEFKEFVGVTGQDGISGYNTDEELVKKINKVREWTQS